MTGEFVEMKPLKPEEEIDEDWSDWPIEPYYVETEIDQNIAPHHDPEAEKMETVQLSRSWDDYFKNREIDGPAVTTSDSRTVIINRKLVHRDCEDFFGNILDHNVLIRSLLTI